MLRVEILDSAGFDPPQIGDGHYGLQGIRERARIVGGIARIHSAPGKGTEILVEIPLVEEAASA